MEAVYYVIAILGCPDGSTQCTQVVTVPTHYASQEACSAGTQQALIANDDLDFPTLIAECRETRAPSSAAQDQPEKLPASAKRG
jgi:hypothetical protein